MQLNRPLSRMVNSLGCVLVGALCLTSYHEIQKHRAEACRDRIATLVTSASDLSLIVAVQRGAAKEFEKKTGRKLVDQAGTTLDTDATLKAVDQTVGEIKGWEACISGTAGDELDALLALDEELDFEARRYPQPVPYQQSLYQI